MMGEIDITNPPLFLIGLLVVVGLGLFLYFTRKSIFPWNFRREERKIKLGQKSERATDSMAPKALSSQALAQKMILDETGMIIPEVSVSEPSLDDLRKRIDHGIEHILPSKPERTSEARTIGKIEDIDPHIRDAVLHQIDHLKDFRTTYQLFKTLDNPNVSMSEISKIIVSDPVLTGKIMKIANSAYFGMQQKVNSIGHALMIIGLLNIKTILCQDGLLKLLSSKNSPESFVIDSLWEHATLTSICASHIQSMFSGLDKGTLFTLGLLHDIGKFVMYGLPMVHEDIVPLNVSVTEFTIYDEERVYGVNHAVVGRLLFDQWGFPEPMGKMIESHHDPSIEGFDIMKLDSKDLKYLLALFLSNQAAKIFASEDKSISAIAPLSPHHHYLV